MAVLGKIRSKGALLVSVIAVGLFAFIAEEAVRSCESTKNNESQQIAEVLGEKMSYQEFQALVDEYVSVIKLTQGRDNFTENETNQFRDMVWSTYIQNQLIAHEAEQLGMVVTDDEMRGILNEGTNQMLLQSPFVNQQTRRFDANALKQFLNEYKKAQASNPQQAEQMRPYYDFWQFIEKTLRQQLLTQKYQVLLASTFLSNSVEAKQTFNEVNNEATVQLAVFPYTSVTDKDVTITDADLKAKYEELKPLFRNEEETRDVKYVVKRVVASKADRAALDKQMAGYAAQLADATDPTDLVRKANSRVPYIAVPVLKTAFPSDIQKQLDSIAVGQTTAVKANVADNTLNIVKLISKQELPDSVEYQAIGVGDQDIDVAHARADSIVKALEADGSQWDALAKKYGQTGEKQWITTQQYQSDATMTADTREMINALNTMAPGTMRTIRTAQGDIIVKVTDRKAMTTKYVAAVIKTKIQFSDETYKNEYNKFNQYVAENNTPELFEKNAKKYGYNVLELNDVSATQHNVASINNTHSQLKWIFDTDINKVSVANECGDNDTFIAMYVTNINKKGYRTLDNAQVKEYVRGEALKDKKAEKLIANANGVNNINAAKAKGAQIVEVKQITFASPVFVTATSSVEPALSGAVSATAKGKFSSHAVKGNGGVYMFQVTGTAGRGQKYDEKSAMQRLTQRAMQNAGSFMQELYVNAKIKDNRYLFF